MSKNKDKKKPQKKKKVGDGEGKNYDFNPLGVYAGIVKDEFDKPEQNGEDF